MAAAAQLRESEHAGQAGPEVVAQAQSAPGHPVYLKAAEVFNGRHWVTSIN